ncbi:hypothetical protein ACFL0U_02360 [Pseudomonadota bacterium]
MKSKIIVFDLHNTLFDEVAEFGPSIFEAIYFFLQKAEEKGTVLKEETICEQLRFFHSSLSDPNSPPDDWNGDVWNHLPCLKKVFGNEFVELTKEAERIRGEKSTKLVKKTAYYRVIQYIKELKTLGNKIYIVTEGTTRVVKEQLSALKILSKDYLDGVITYPSVEGILFPKIDGVFYREFPKYKDDMYCRKPSALLLAQIVILEITNRMGKEITIDQVFDITYDELREEKEEFSQRLQRDIGTRVFIKNETLYTDLAQEIMKNMVMVGDSKFKDGFLAKNFGVQFIFAKYGKNVSEGKEEVKKNISMLDNVSGWDPKELKLTHNAGKSEAVSSLKPNYVANTQEKLVDFLTTIVEQQK